MTKADKSNNKIGKIIRSGSKDGYGLRNIVMGQTTILEDKWVDIRVKTKLKTHISVKVAELEPKYRSVGRGVGLLIELLSWNIIIFKSGNKANLNIIGKVPK